MELLAPFLFGKKMNLSTAISSGLLAVGTTVVKNSKTYLKSVALTGDGTNQATLIVYDNATTATGTVLAKLKTNAVGMTSSMEYSYPLRAEHGIVVVVSGTGAEAIVSFDA